MSTILRFKRVIAAVLLCFAAFGLSWAYDFEADGLYYNFNNDGVSVTVTFKEFDTQCYFGDIAIPETVTLNGTTYSVTSIGEDAFAWCSSLTSVTLPESVTSIGDDAFAACTSLTSVTLPESVTSIGRTAFWGCKLTSITIPGSVKFIGEGAFAHCDTLSSVIFEDGVGSIDSLAFYSCPLSSVISLSESVPQAEDYAFEEIPDSAVLYVPASAIEAYKASDGWRRFSTILPLEDYDDATGIEELKSDGGEDGAVFDLTGRQLKERPSHGFYIQGGKKYFMK